MQLRGDPLLASDLKLAGEAGNIVQATSWTSPPHPKHPSVGRRRALTGPGAAAPRRAAAVRSGHGLLFHPGRHRRGPVGPLFQRRPLPPDHPGGGAHQPLVGHRGVHLPRRTLSLPVHRTDPAAHPAPGLRRQVAETILETHEEADIPEDQKVNVVGVMLEAFCNLTDFSTLGEVEAVQNVYAPWHWLEEHAVSGNLLTNIFAGGTVDTEWCFLTGYSSYDDFVQPTDSYVWYFDRQGYNTRGSHPGNGWFYDRENINQYLGFQEYWFSENHYEKLVDPVGAQWNSDYLLVDEIVTDLQTQLEEDNGPVFSFSVSIQNHGPYEWTYTANEAYLDPEETGLPEEACHVFNNYLHGVSMTISALTGMVHDLEEMEEPVVVVLFGDHKPGAATATPPIRALAPTSPSPAWTASMNTTPPPTSSGPTLRPKRC